MKLLVGLLLGSFLAFLMMLVPRAIFAAALAVFDSAPESDEALTTLTFFASWVLSTFIIVRGARSVSKVFSRAFLLGAAACLAMAVITPVGILTGPPPDKVPPSWAAFAAAGTFLVTACACIIGCAVSNDIDRKMQPESEAPSLRCG